MSNDRLVWVDLETTGLEPRKELLLEVGFIITDLNLEMIDEKDWVIWDGPNYDNKVFDDFITNMHTKSGLIDDARAEGWTVEGVREDVLDFLKGHGIGASDPMCGSSVQFDREWLRVWMPKVHDIFSYRNIDISTVKELCRRFNAPVYAQIEKYTSKREMHRVMPDLEDTISEAKFYLDNFLYVSMEGE